MPLATRREIVQTYSRVSFHKRSTACTAVTTSRANSKAYSHPIPEVRKAEQDKARCKNVAHWRFRALKSSWCSDGDYCWNHLFSQGLLGDMPEEMAFQRWYERKYGADS